jgi:hypothetical protein
METSRHRTPDPAPASFRDPEGVPIATMATPKEFGIREKVSRGRAKFFRPGIAMVNALFRRIPWRADACDRQL